MKDILLFGKSLESSYSLLLMPEVTQSIIRGVNSRQEDYTHPGSAACDFISPCTSDSKMGSYPLLSRLLTVGGIPSNFFRETESTFLMVCG